MSSRLTTTSLLRRHCELCNRNFSRGYFNRHICTPLERVITDPSRLIRVKITAPTQGPNPSPQSRALMVQVPARALRQGGSSGSPLRQVLSRAIPQALRLPVPFLQSAGFIQTQINQAFRLG
jgi:hypothetical protein